MVVVTTTNRHVCQLLVDRYSMQVLLRLIKPRGWMETSHDHKNMWFRRENLWTSPLQLVEGGETTIRGFFPYLQGCGWTILDALLKPMAIMRFALAARKNQGNLRTCRVAHYWYLFCTIFLLLLHRTTRFLNIYIYIFL
jgi:hypothetical protein